VTSIRADATIAVLGGCGGAGATGFAIALAAVAGRGRIRKGGPDRPGWRGRVPAEPAIGAVLVDLDGLGGGIDVVLGIETAPGVRWSGLHLDGGLLEPDQLADGLPWWAGAAVLACDRPDAPTASAVGAVLAAARPLGPVIVDAGRFATEAQEAALAASDLIVLVVPADVRAITAAAAVQARNADLLADRSVLVVRVERSTVRPALVAELLGLPLCGILGSDRALRAARESGIDERRLGRRTGRTAAAALAAIPERLLSAPPGGRH
jgi:hypothetical protein